SKLLTLSPRTGRSRRLPPAFGLFRLLRLPLTLLDPLDEVMGRHVRTVAPRLCSLLRPCEMAVLAVILFVHQAKLSYQPHRHIGEHGLSRELRVIHPQRFALRTTNRLAQRSFCRIPTEQKLCCPLELAHGHFEAHSRRRPRHEPQFFQPQFDGYFC